MARFGGGLNALSAQAEHGAGITAFRDFERDLAHRRRDIDLPAEQGCFQWDGDSHANIIAIARPDFARANKDFQ